MCTLCAFVHATPSARCFPLPRPPAARPPLTVRARSRWCPLSDSDSSKDAGKLASLWELHTAQEELLAIGKAAGVAINFFHGRGGSIGRGGGPQHLALLSQPAGSIDGAYRVTVQGEQIYAFFGSHGGAVHTLQSYAVSVLEHTVAPPALPTASQRALMQKLADASATSFQQTIYHSAGGVFAQYFHTASPSSALASMNLGSRPAKRKAAGGIETLRAIPWVFAWTQMRLHLPVWLGGGEALKAMADTPEGLAELRAMYAQWPFFSALVDLVELELSKVRARPRSLRRSVEPPLASRASADAVTLPPPIRWTGRLSPSRAEPLCRLQGDGDGGGQ